VPRVDTLEALTAAETFGVTPLGLQVDPDAEAAIRESLRRAGVVGALELVVPSLQEATVPHRELPTYEREATSAS
jgi:hypothetical protein